MNEYDRLNKIGFEGNYINEKKNGYVKLYSGDKIKLEKEYINDEETGNIKEYNYKGQLSFEGKYINGYREGK